MFQKLTLVGNLGSDPEMRYMQDGTAVTNFSLATNRRWTNGDGNKGEETAWFRVQCWGKQAENANQYLERGRQVMVEGRMVVDPETGGPKTFTRRDGSIGAAFEVRALNVTFLGGRDNGDHAYTNYDGGRKAEVEEDEIPF